MVIFFNCVISFTVTRHHFVAQKSSPLFPLTDLISLSVEPSSSPPPAYHLRPAAVCSALLSLLLSGFPRQQLLCRLRLTLSHLCSLRAGLLVPGGTGSLPALGHEMHLLPHRHTTELHPGVKAAQRSAGNHGNGAGDSVGWSCAEGRVSGCLSCLPHCPTRTAERRDLHWELVQPPRAELYILQEVSILERSELEGQGGSNTAVLVEGHLCPVTSRSPPCSQKAFPVQLTVSETPPGPFCTFG